MKTEVTDVRLTVSDTLADAVERAMEQGSAVVFCSVGTVGTLILRLVRKLIIERLGEVPKHIRFLAIDATGQPRYAHADPLPEGSFVNLSDKLGLFQLFRAAWKHPEYKDRLTEEICAHAFGKGSGAIPAVAWFLFKENLSRIDEAIGRLLLPLTGSEFVRTCEKANVTMRRHGIHVAAEQAIDVVFVGSPPGGTNSVTPDVAGRLQETMAGQDMAANFSYFLMPLAIDLGDNVDRVRMRHNTFARLAELADVNETKAIFQYVNLFSEPTMAGFHHDLSRAASLLSELPFSLGKAFQDKAVDMLPVVHRRRGPLQQFQMFNGTNRAVLKATPFADLEGFVQAFLARQATLTDEPHGQPSFSEFLQHCGLTRKGLERDQISLSAPDIPDWVNSSNFQLFAKPARTKLADEAKELVRRRLAPFARALESLEEELPKELERRNSEFGPQASADFASGIETLLNRLKAQFHADKRDLRERDVHGNAKARLAITVANQELRACAWLWSQAIGHLKKRVNAIARLKESYRTAAKVHETIHHQGDSRVSDLSAVPCRHHVVLDQQFLCRHVMQAVPELKARIRQLRVAEPADLADKIRGETRETAAAFGHLKSVRSALELLGEDADRVIENVMRAARPRIRTLPYCNLDRETSQWAFAAADEELIGDVMERLSFNNRYVPPADDEWIFIRLQAGYEPGGVVATQEAAETFLNERFTISPFSDPGYEPRVDLTRPPESEWWATCAIPLHRFLETSVITRDCRKRFCYQRNGHSVVLGRSHYEAWKTLFDPAAAAKGLPTLEQLAELTEKMAYELCGDELLDQLRGLERKLTEHYRRSNDQTRKVLYVERSALRGLITAMAEDEEQDQIDDEMGADTKPRNRTLRGPARDVTRGDNGQHLGS